MFVIFLNKRFDNEFWNQVWFYKRTKNKSTKIKNKNLQWATPLQLSHNCITTRQVSLPRDMLYIICIEDIRYYNRAFQQFCVQDRIAINQDMQKYIFKGVIDLFTS